MAQPAPFWFLNNEVVVTLSSETGVDGISTMLFTLPRDEAPPMHVHRSEDEVFHVIEGEVRFAVDGRTVLARAGNTLLGPQGKPHGFRVLLPVARMLIITHGGFERLVRSMARPALRPGPPALEVPSPELQQELFTRCAAEGIDLIGPPID